MSKFAFADKELFLQILGNHPVVEDKRSNSYNIERKKKAWDNITAEFNVAAIETRTTVQLKRLWDKIKRSRKEQLATERREIMATGGGPARLTHAPDPAVDKIVPYIHYEIDVMDDSDGIQLHKVQGYKPNAQEKQLELRGYS
ncbi:unnamed protein product [Callosobruchus maculatus]|uniref:Regulatory protein zeste n=1 Tax=Callosobruchus maculatus TaxID=64391 RepID=A0A653BVQ6_CALMS|nr:unnamed protein product [Callosobruchus maculatus]